jgi:YidC/Oxa1 family membrane protein insertase
MDRKSILVIAICFIVLISWYPLLNKIWPPKPLPRTATNAVATTYSATNATLRSAPAAPAALPEAGAPAPAPAPAFDTNQPEQFLEITNANAHYTFTSFGGGLKQVELLHYAETVDRSRARPAPTNNFATLNGFTPAPTLALLDGPAQQGDGIFKLTRVGNAVRAEKSLPNGLTIIKQFEPTTNYLVLADVRLENHSSAALTLPPRDWVVGTATPMSGRDDGSSVGVMWSDGSKSQDIVGASYFSKNGFMCMPRTPPAEYRGGQSNVVWAAVHNQFFALAVMPSHPADQLLIQKLDLPAPSALELRQNSRLVRQPAGYEARLVYPALTLAANQSTNWQVYIFAGPKEYRTLAGIASALNNNVDLIMGFNGFFGFFSKGLLLGMNWLHQSLQLSYGWAIIVITIFIKVLFWPLTQASTRSMKRLQLLQPQMKAIQEKYKEDPVKMNRKVMEFMKENKVSPLGGCLPMALQMPVFIGFFYMIRSAIELRGASFLWVPDLSSPDTLFMIPGLDFPFNLLPLIMGATMLWQAQMTPPSPGMDPMQQKMMRYMPMIFMVFLYNFSAGLTLYWTVQNLLTIAQTKLTKAVAADPAAKAPALTPPQKRRK